MFKLTRKQKEFIDEYTNILSFNIVGVDVIDIISFTSKFFRFQNIFSDKIFFHEDKQLPITIRNIIPKYDMIVFDVSDNSINKLQDIPENVTSLFLDNTDIVTLPKLPKSLKILELNDDITDFSNIFDVNLKRLYIQSKFKNNTDLKTYRDITGCELIINDPWRA